MLRKIFVNIILIVIVLGTIEFYCFNKTKSENIVFKEKADRLECNNTQKHVTKYKILEDFKPVLYRKSFRVHTNKKPVLWFGCSFAEGAGLEDKDTPCYKIAKLTGRSCLNRAKGATGTQFIYYQLMNKKFRMYYPQADYIVYVFIFNHIQRLYNYQVNPLIDMFNIRYKLEGNKLKSVKPFFKPFYSSFFVKRILNKRVINQMKKEEEDYKLFNAIMKRIVYITGRYYPNSKFIMLEFPDLSGKELPKYEIEKLKSFGIIYVKATDLIGNTDIYDKKYWLPDDIHPTSAAWDLILPEFVSRYLSE